MAGLEKLLSWNFTSYREMVGPRQLNAVILLDILPCVFIIINCF